MLDYKNKKPILEISKKYELPPMSVVYQILIETKHESHKIDKMIKKQHLPKDILLQMPNIIKNDPMYWFPHIMSHIIPTIHNNIRKIHCNFLLKYDMQKKGKCPDILFNELCTHKKKSFMWIVFKPYTLFDNSLHIHDMQKTINNFKKYGIGLILYVDIICSKSFIKKIDAYVDTYDFFTQ